MQKFLAEIVGLQSLAKKYFTAADELKYFFLVSLFVINLFSPHCP